MTSDLLEENTDLRKQVEELKDQIATRNGKIAILNSENERLKAIVLGNEEEISGLKEELKAEKDYSATLRKEIDEYTNSHTLCVKYKELEKENTELKAGKNANEGKIYELSMKITELQELLTDCLFYCFHVDPYYTDCLQEDEIFERAEKLGVKYNV